MKPLVELLALLACLLLSVILALTAPWNPWGWLGLGWRVRWRIARWLDRLEDTCWAKLAMWALDAREHGFWEVLHLRHTAGECEARGEPIYYCGKCRVTGYHRQGQ